MSMQSLVISSVAVLGLSLIMSAVVSWIQRTGRRGTTLPPPAPAGWVLGLIECFFYFAVLSANGLAFLAGAWLVFKAAAKWQSSAYSKPSPELVRAEIRPFQVGTLGNLLVGVLGAAILQGMK